ncbi:MAG: GH13_4 / GH13_16 / GH13_36 / GH13 / GH13_ 17 / GH13_31 / GH13_29 / GH13_30 / GH13_40 / GH13 _23 / GH13_18 / GH13_35 / GH13_2 / GH13_21 / GH13_20 [uncultured Thermomicrobiales bacterium]|uniref:GH13_4 / GH13_16 / GH13_36 / GH13 / GH13_ 17 / GH13_31 / GH13_29 / GH13_30 / GH13_40 / GH13 _23 / GH13_18 / GH13_35 / GH13_2 / GH13_21 / GH13_20 n=1 Tax=uncultured Thermomicrobiales bacterium TaxID=1645740 RepID=A0A6J4V446_9BACT|nr:MAG: GH13_4 / GH13_16 / GH13_36 / GH13 / GH13_ 17 / GH13_31 / GH13_29 / GH13_30 / GH13_40 / GH13 _23 / GH13_18 / GH13_35 / GH13_2 / GH13_21 / GH13_20 [uncultured Thermomicrobiales bacterium]
MGAESEVAAQPQSLAPDADRRMELSLRRLRPRLEEAFRAEPDADPALWDAFSDRLDRHFPALFGPLVALYGDRYDFFFHLERVLLLALRSWLDRPADLRELDARREADPAWFQSERMIGAVAYVDRLAGDLAGLRTRLPYLRELGVTYLHLMPLFKVPAANSDGGYAVSSYRDVHPAFGTMAQLADLATDLRREGISLALDFVFNHTSDEHAWAGQLLAGADPDDEEASAYLTFPDRTLPDAYGRTLRDIFPATRPGSFTYRPDLGRWVWTTFYSFQWDLNYANPTVFWRMAGEMLFLANRGVEVLRLDAVAFVWKRMGTASESLPEAHLVVRAYNVLLRLAAPALLFKSEAIVHPDEVASYIAPDECQLSYNPLLMALLWEALATRRATLLRQSLAERLRIAPGCAWINYVRGHDDIGWTFDDGDAAAVGINGYDHRRFLNAFYTGRFPGSFARGLPFQENPRTGDARISGTTASLAGLEKALAEEGPAEVDLAVGRILLLHAVTLAVGGIPVLYLGDELATTNDYGYRDEGDKVDDSRWVHRPKFDWDRAARRDDPTTIEGRVSTGLRRLIAARRAHPAFGGNRTEVVDPGNDHVFAFVRRRGGDRVLVLANLTEAPQNVAANQLRVHGLAYAFADLVTDTPTTPDPDAGLTLAPYQVAWLVPGSPTGER